MSIDLTPSGTVAYATGKFGQAADLSAGALIAAANGALAIATGTIEAWVKTTATSLQVLFGDDGSSHWLGMSAAGKATTNGGATSTVSINDGSWHHVAWVFNGTIVTIYVDGAQSGTTASATGFFVSNGAGATRTAIGDFGAGAQGHFRWVGLVDEFRVSNVARYTGTFTPPTSAFTGDASTVALYHLDGNGTDTAAAAPANATIAPNDPNIIYSPYTWLVSGTVAQTNCAGAYLRATISGSPTSIVANFDMTNVTGISPGKVIINIDGVITTATIAATVPIPIPGGNTWKQHVVELVFSEFNQSDNRWNTPVAAAAYFKGFTVANGAATTDTTYRRPRNLLALGDSLAEGLFTLNSGGADARMSWAFPLRDLLGAELGQVGFGGSGLSSGGNGNVPVWTSIYNQLWNGQARSLISPAEPDAVLIQLGTNGVTQANATTLLNGLLAAMTNTKIVVVGQWNQSNKATWQAAIAASAAPSRVTFVDTAGWFDTTQSPDNVHPYGSENIGAIAPRIAAAVAPLLGGGGVSKRFVNVGGTAKPVGTVIKA